MLQKYPLQTSAQYSHALREILQELVLCGLWRAKFFERALFYGGTALRILHGLNRFSEDMDFSLLAPDQFFQLEPFGKAIEMELRSWGFTVELQLKQKVKTTAIQSAFLKADTTQAFLAIETPPELIGPDKTIRQLKIKIEIDTNPPSGFTDEAKLILQPIPFSVRTMSLPSLFAGKMHAVLCRQWGSRVKGRDWYDLVWYVSRSVPVNLVHLEQRMRQSGHWEFEESLTDATFRSLLEKRIESLDVESAREDTKNFVSEPGTLASWNRAFFLEIASLVACLKS